MSAAFPIFRASRLTVRIFALTLAVVTSISSVCNPGRVGVDVAKLFPDVPALAALRGVHPGMTAGELRSLRKSATPAPYIGLTETLNGDTIKYRMASPPARQSASEEVVLGAIQLLDGDSIDGIDLWQPASGPDSATQVWSGRATQMLRRNQGALDCFTIMRAGKTRFALSQREGVWFGVALIEEHQERDIRGPITFPAIVDTFVSSRLELYVPRNVVREQFPCPGSGAGADTILR